MANDLNRVLLVGRLTREPELKETGSGAKLCNFTLASNRTQFVKDGENVEHAGFFDCTAWGKLGEMIAQYAKKGQRVGVDAHLRFSSWEHEGQKRSKVDIHVENFQFLDSKKDGTNDGVNDGENAGTNIGTSEPFNDDIPF